VPEDAEDERVDPHEDERVRERPRDAEHRAAVLRVQVAPEEVPEELAVAVEVGVDRHWFLVVRAL
jgi:plasmid stability protein